MTSSPALKPASPKRGDLKPTLGLRAWMERVLVECDRAAAGFDADAVHDLRVALRRCRSLADGVVSMDPDRSWKEMKKAGKKLFQALGELRDLQVMAEWIEKLSGPDDPVAVRLLNHVRTREANCKQLAFKDLDQFDRKQWRQWSRSLPRRAARVRLGSMVYLHLATEKWQAAYDLHKHAMHTRSQIALHQLRIGVKRFRYTVENFLPKQHALWGDDLKELQDLLGEVHDLDVLWATAMAIGAFPDIESRQRWRGVLNAERTKRIARYREKMVGTRSLWRTWRAALPQGNRLRSAAMSRLRTWAGYLDPDVAHSQRVTQVALQLYDGLVGAGALVADPALGAREILEAATFMHDVGKAKGREDHQKRSFRLIRNLPCPLGWSAHELELSAVVARYHRGALPRQRSKAMQRLDAADRRIALQLAGVLRLSRALDFHDHDRHRTSLRNGHKPRVEVQSHENMMLIRVPGYAALERSAEKVAAARHLLETILRRPVLIRSLPTARIHRS